MRLLRKILLSLGLILLLACLKIIFRKTAPHSLLFHYNLFSSLQLLLLFWAIVTGLLETKIWKKESRTAAFRKSLLLFLMIIAMIELNGFLLIHNPAVIPRGLLSPCRYYYNNYQRDVLQYNKNIARYDPA